MKKRHIIVPAILVLFSMFWFSGWPVSGQMEVAALGRPLPRLDLTLTTEAARSMDVLIIGLGPRSGNYFMLPELAPMGRPVKAGRKIEEEFFHLDFELCHGGIMRCLPERTTVYVALPDPEVLKDSRGGEKEFFLSYLKEHCGWTDGRIREKLRFFKTPASLVWSQDAGEPLGYDKQGRLVIGVGTGDIQNYKESIQALAKAYPKKFRVVELGNYISAEGGDENLARMPDGNIGVMIGHHRVVNYLERRDGKAYDGQAVGDADIKEAEQSFSRSFFGLPAVILPRAALKDPSLASPELFHLDMMVTLLAHQGKPDAFVPTYDRLQDNPSISDFLNAEAIGQIQKEFDLMASELSSLGYPVSRLPFNDHPVRSPANVCRFRNPDTGNQGVMLGKYPSNFSGEGKDSPRAKVAHLIQRLNDEFQIWRQANRAEADRQLLKAIGDVWEGLMQVEKERNPMFEAQAKVFRDRGYEVVEVPMFAWGAGSVHCQTLH